MNHDKTANMSLNIQSTLIIEPHHVLFTVCLWCVFAAAVGGMVTAGGTASRCKGIERTETPLHYFSFKAFRVSHGLITLYGTMGLMVWWFSHSSLKKGSYVCVICNVIRNIVLFKYSSSAKCLKTANHLFI